MFVFDFHITTPKTDVSSLSMSTDKHYGAFIGSIKLISDIQQFIKEHNAEYYSALTRDDMGVIRLIYSFELSTEHPEEKQAEMLRTLTKKLKDFLEEANAVPFASAPDEVARFLSKAAVPDKMAHLPWYFIQYDDVTYHPEFDNIMKSFVDDVDKGFLGIGSVQTLYTPLSDEGRDCRVLTSTLYSCRMYRHCCLFYASPDEQREFINAVRLLFQ